MKNIAFYSTMLLALLLSISSFSQSDESLIRTLENKEREAILRNDTTELDNLMLKKIVVQNPENSIVGFRQIIDRIKSGKINYSTFERKIENIALLNGIAVVMGLETLVPQGDTQQAGKAVERRFTNIWTKEENTWKLTARQATIISSIDVVKGNCLTK